MSSIISLIAGFYLFCAGQSLTNELMACNTKSIRLLRMLFYLMEGYPQTLENCIHFLQKSAFYIYCSELKASGFDVRQKDAMEGNTRSAQRLKQKLVAFLNQGQNHDN
jgi:hypothetical protein